jgi:hypothetical protein
MSDIISVTEKALCKGPRDYGNNVDMPTNLREVSCG